MSGKRVLVSFLLIAAVALISGCKKSGPQPEPASASAPAPFRWQIDQFADQMDSTVYRAKGFVRFPDGTYLFNFIAGRWELEPFRDEGTVLVFIGRHLKEKEQEILKALKKCERRG